MTLEQRIKAFIQLGIRLEELSKTLSANPNTDNPVEGILRRAEHLNPWFIRENVLYAMHALGEMMKEGNLRKWLGTYTPATPKKIGVVNAGNIPFVGFHDFLCVLISGNIYIGKNASDDTVLLPWVANELCAFEPAFKESIHFADQLKDMNAVIATGSNNTARYFEYYFGKYPHIIRRNRNAVAVLSGKESAGELKALGEDIFRYFGLGCRNVSKLFVPVGYDFRNFFEGVFSYSSVMQHNKYMNNYDYNRAIFLMRQIPFLENNFLIVREEKSIPSPISVIHYECYEDADRLKQNLNEHKEEIQCIVGEEHIPFGTAQCPALWDYADGVDTMKFLTSL